MTDAAITTLSGRAPAATRPDAGRWSDDRGFTLVELLTAATVTLFVLSISVNALMQAQKTNQLATTIVDTNANLRSGLNFMVRDLVQTGAGIPIGGIPIPNGAGSVVINRPSWAGGVTFPAGTALNSVTPGNSLGPAINGQQTDIVNILYEDTSIDLGATGVTVTIGDANGTSATVAGVQISGVVNGVDGGDLIMFENGLGRALQCVTSVNGQVMSFANNDAFRLNQPGAAGGSIRALRDTVNNNWPTMRIKRIKMLTFYLEDPTGNAPRLMRRENFDTARPIALVLENLQMSYDIADGATNPTNVAAPTSPSQIRKINLWLYGRSEKAILESRRNFRTYMATQVSLRNLSFVNTL
ncbi:MAG: hypothetical protein U0Q12_24210 [Vicinamibacterales bacterium]